MGTENSGEFSEHLILDHVWDQPVKIVEIEGWRTVSVCLQRESYPALT